MKKSNKFTCVDCGTKLGKPKLTTITIPIPSRYGIENYTKEQKKLHKDIQKLITRKYRELGADDCMIVFSRVYSTYALSQLVDEKKIKFIKNDKKTKKK